MALDDFSSDDSQSEEQQKRTGNQKKFDQFTQEEIEEFLAQAPTKFHQKDYDWTWEWVYEADHPVDDLTVRIYSSVDKRTGKARDKGDDALRVAIVDEEAGGPVMNEKRVNRIQTWRKNLGERINTMVKAATNTVKCDECGGRMVIRTRSKDGKKFWGCKNYPDCKNAKDLDEVTPPQQR